MGNLWSVDNPLIDKKHQFLVRPTIESFQAIDASLTWHEKCDYTYRTWKTASLYTFMIEKKTNLMSAELICDYIEIEREVINGFQNHEDWSLYPMLVLWKVTGKKKYEKIIDNVNDPYFKAQANTLLTDVMI